MTLVIVIKYILHLLRLSLRQGNLPAVAKYLLLDPLKGPSLPINQTAAALVFPVLRLRRMNTAGGSCAGRTRQDEAGGKGKESRGTEYTSEESRVV